MKKYIIILIIGLILGGGAGFAVGIYTLPILIANETAKQQKEDKRQQIKAELTEAMLNEGKSKSKQAYSTVEVIENGIVNENEISKSATKIVVKQFKKYNSKFNPDAKDSDFFHWGRGDIVVNSNQVIFTDNVELAPGPDYRLYLTPKYLETEAEFMKIKNSSAQVAKITMFDGKQVFNIPENVDIENYNSVVIWCEAFKEFITVAKYKD